MRAKLLNFNNQFKKEGTSGTYNFLPGIKEIGVELVDQNDNDYDYIIFSTGNPNAFGGVVNQHAINVIKEIAETNKPVIFLFSDFNCLPSGINKYCERFNLPYKWEDYKENFYMIHYCQDEKGFENFVESKKGALKYKYYKYLDFGYIRRYGEDKGFEYGTINKPCYIGNHRSGKRTKFLNKININNGWNLYGSRKGKYIESLEGDNFDYKGICKFKDIGETMKSHIGHIITYDDIGLKYKCSSTRLTETICAGAIPIIDSRMCYIFENGFPQELKHLFFGNNAELQRALDFAKSDYENINLLLQQRLKKRYSVNMWDEVLSFIYYK